MAPYKIGVLSTARIVNLGIIQPAKELGCELYSVAAREPHRAKKFSEEFNFSRYHSSYEELVSDPLVEIIYNPLPNGLHAPWNIKALENGKHVLTEKPFASNHKEAKILKHAADMSGKLLMEAFHYCFHPVTHRIYSLVESGILGKLKHIEITLVMPEAADNDPRWDYELAGGAVMDLGCYALHAFLRFSPYTGGKPIIVKSVLHKRKNIHNVDERADISVRFPNGTTGHTYCNMSGDKINFSIKVEGEKGHIIAMNFIHPHMDDRIIIDTETIKTTEWLGKSFSYFYQLKAFLELIENRRVSPVPLSESVDVMALIDIVYELAGFSPRPLLKVK